MPTIHANMPFMSSSFALSPQRLTPVPQFRAFPVFPAGLSPEKPAKKKTVQMKQEENQDFSRLPPCLCISLPHIDIIPLLGLRDDR